MFTLELNPGLPGCRVVCLRELCGHDELAVDGTGLLAATLLLDRLLVQAPGTTLGPGRAWDLPLCDRDRLLAAVFRRQFGDRIEASADCGDCGEPFELRFELPGLASAMAVGDKVMPAGPDADGCFELADGTRFRLPTAADLQVVAGMDPEQSSATLLQRCVNGTAAVDRTAVEHAMATAGPVLASELAAQCPHCGHAQLVSFDIQDYLPAALAADRPYLFHEIHWLARAYGWSHAEIMALPRTERRAYVRLIEAGRGGWQ